MSNPFRQPPPEERPSQVRQPWQEVVIRGVSIPFDDLVVLLIKLAFAAIPATIIIALIWLMLFVVLGSIGRALLVL